MTDRTLGWVSGVSLVLVFGLLAGCKKQSDISGLQGLGTGTISFSAPIGTTSDFFIQVKPLAGTTNYSHLPTSWTSTCKISSTEVLQDDRCLVEVPEFDLYFQGLTLQYNFPAGKCAYAEVQPFFYYGRAPGIGPTAMAMTLTDGTLSSFAVTGAGVNASASASSTGVLSCDRDYSKSPNGKNCCEGAYSIAITTVKSTPASSVTSAITGDWGGKTGNCLEGPGADSQARSVSLYPRPNVYFLNGQNLSGEYLIPSPLQKGRATNIYISNFFADSGGAPDWPITDAPTAFRSAGAGIPDAQPWYEFTCLDPNEDVVHRMRVLIRSWTRASDFQGHIEAAYNTGGAEPVPFGDQGYLDRPNWASFMAGFPGTI